MADIHARRGVLRAGVALLGSAGVLLMGKLDASATAVGAAPARRDGSSLKFLEVLRAENAEGFLESITTYSGIANSVVEPSVLFFPQGWNGWRYWCAAGPYENSNARLENPSIWVSQDGMNWQVPPGGVNPVVPPPEYGNNCDPQIFMTGDVMCLTWTESNNRSVGRGERVYRKASTDGITWGRKTLVMESEKNFLHELLSVRFGWDPRARVWVSWALSMVEGRPYAIHHRTADSLDGPWSRPVTCNVPLPESMTNLWEYEIKNVDGEWWMLINIQGVRGEDSALWLGTSSDGVNWTLGEHPVLRAGKPGSWDSALMYKAGFVPSQDRTSVEIWYSALQHGQWHIGHTEASLGLGHLETGT